ncbi:MAG: adenylate kinase [Clostridia bacterium]|nr:adenylate kinase [Clostridia bacterium]
MKLIILGAPGAGKGTQAEMLSEKFSIPAISTGAIIREAIEKKTPFGLKAKAYIDKGELLPDDAVIDMLMHRIAMDDCRNGYILDGFPRTVSQAEALLNNGIKIDTALSLEVDDDVIVDRLAGRRECSSCRAPYHVKANPPKTEGICDRCGAPLIQREDDNPETIKARLKVYHEKTAPVKKYYEEKGLLKRVVGKSTIDATAQEVLSSLGNL